MQSPPAATAPPGFPRGAMRERMRGMAVAAGARTCTRGVRGQLCVLGKSLATSESALRPPPQVEGREKSSSLRSEGPRGSSQPARHRAGSRRRSHAKAEVASALPKDPGVELGTEPPNCLLLQCPPRIHQPLPLGRLQSLGRIEAAHGWLKARCNQSTCRKVQGRLWEPLGGRNPTLVKRSELPGGGGSQLRGAG